MRVTLDDDLHELLIAELSDLAFESFVQEEGCLLGYVQSRFWNDVSRESIERWLHAHGLHPRFEEREYEPQNWNRLWEETVRPLAVGRFLVKPTWSDLPPEAEGRIVLEIDPKMSFGTGYHESTRLALRLLPDQVRAGARVLDAGTGTGVLAIAAARLGAKDVFGFDSDPWSFVNATENVLLNRVESFVRVAEGSLETVPDGQFDLVLANINRNVLIEMMPFFARRLVEGGRAIIAGLLAKDAEVMRRHASHWGLIVEEELVEGEWWSAVLARPAS